MTDRTGPGDHRVQPGRRRRLRRPRRADDRRVAAGARATTARTPPSSPTASRSATRCAPRVADGADVVITTGGTGISPTDATPGGHPGACSTTRCPGWPTRSAPRGAGGADRGALPRHGRRGRPHAGGQPARIDRRGPRRAARPRGRARPRRRPAARRRPPMTRSRPGRRAPGRRRRPTRSTSTSTPRWSDDRGRGRRGHLRRRGARPRRRARGTRAGVQRPPDGRGRSSPRSPPTVAARAPGVRAIAVEPPGRAPWTIGDVALALRRRGRPSQAGLCDLRRARRRDQAALPVWKHQVFSDGSDEWVNST